MRHFIKNGGLKRVMFSLLGIGLIVQGILDEQGIAIVLGLWPLSLGVLGLGCARGSCEVNPRQK